MTEIRNDDVLQAGNFSKDQVNKFSRKMPFLYFLEADEVFRKYNYPCTLAVLAEGIDKNWNWVDYIKRNQHRYKIELHGSSHLWYSKMTEESGYNDLKQAKEKIENTFGIKITTWYVPFGRNNIPEWGDRVCERLGIKMDRPIMKQLPYFWDKLPEGVQCNFHYWDKKQVKQIESIIKSICKR